MEDLAVFLKGFLLNAGLIIAIGAQNAFVLACGLAKKHVWPVVIVSSVGDALLIIVGVWLGGLGSAQGWTPFLSLAGALFLCWFGIKSTRAVFAAEVLSLTTLPTTRRAAIITAIALSLLNPHAILDMTVIFGGISASLPSPQKVPFAVGGTLMSFVWFFGLGYGATLCAPFLAKPSAWRIIHAFIACIMFGFAGALLWPLIA